MNEEQKYLFDVNGFIVIENVREFLYSRTFTPFPFSAVPLPERSMQLAAWDGHMHAVACVSIVIVWYLLALE